MAKELYVNKHRTVREFDSILGLYKFGIGPSSSHTIGPMIAANNFARILRTNGKLVNLNRILVELRGSMANVSGAGHKTPRAIGLGLEFVSPSTVDGRTIEEFDKRQKDINPTIKVADVKDIIFLVDRDFIGNPNPLSKKYNAAMVFKAYDKDNMLIHEKSYYSIGGGYVMDPESHCLLDEKTLSKYKEVTVVHSAKEFFSALKKSGENIVDFILNYEMKHGLFDSKEECMEFLDSVISTMMSTIDKGSKNKNKYLAGSLRYPRTSWKNFYELEKMRSEGNTGTEYEIKLLNSAAIAVSEVNADGVERIVTAPTCGAAGVIPSLLYFMKNIYSATSQDLRDFLIVAAAIGHIEKIGASIAGSDVGCQGEIGVGCSMAAAAFTNFKKGSLEQIESAAAISLQQFLGMTCDPVLGYVQIPCINRNAFGANTAFSLSLLVLSNIHSQTSYVSLDSVIEAVKISGANMSTDLKETSRGGLALTTLKHNRTRNVYIEKDEETLLGKKLGIIDNNDEDDSFVGHRCD